MRRLTIILTSMLCCGFAYGASEFSDADANFEHIKQMILKQYVDPHVSEEQLMEGATQGMLNSLNRTDSHGEAWNKLLTPSEYQEMQGDLKGKITGIGVGVKFDEATGLSNVLDVIPHSVAEKAGLKAGDEIVSVNGKTFKGKTLQDVVFEIRGDKPGEFVTLKALRGDRLMTKTMKREQVDWQPVESSIVGNKIGLLTIHYFAENTADLVKAALKTFKKDGITALVIDLRNNGGGMFEIGVKTASLFLPKGAVIVRTQGRDESPKEIKAENDPVITDLPLALIVNEYTGSSAELFTASLSENLGAKVIGQKTLGKWNAQMVELLPNHYAVKFTVETFRTPHDKSYQDKGLMPDILVTADDTSVQAGYKMAGLAKRLRLDPQLRAAVAVLK